MLAPASDALQRGGRPTGRASAPPWRTPPRVAEDAAQATAQLPPKIGRARPLAEKSYGTPDAGAVSLALALRAVSNALIGSC